MVGCRARVWDERGRYVSRGVGDFKIDLQYADNRSGPTLSGEVEFTHVGDRWKTVWGFPGCGVLEFTYQNVSFVKEVKQLIDQNSSSS